MSGLDDFAAVMAFEEAEPTLPVPDGRSPIPWTPEPWSREHRKKRRGGDLVNPVVADDPALRKLLREARWDSFDRIIVQFSGGKDSVASLLWLLEAGAPRDRIELWHQNVDGDHDEPAVFDWPLTQSYVESFAEAFQLPLLYQFRIGGLAGEIERVGRSMEDTIFESPLITDQGLSKLVTRVGTKPPDKHRDYELGLYRWATDAGYLEGRQGMPIKSAADMRARYCTSAVKIEPANAALRYDPRFSRKRLGRVPRLLVVTGERREEGGNRAAYSQVQWHPTHAPSKRVAVHWRPILHLDKVAIYKLLQRWKVQPSPVYELGVWGRCSCSGCIFSSKSQWAGLREVLPEHFDRIVQIERRLDRAGKRVLERRKRGDEYTNVVLDEWVPPSVAAAAEQWRPRKGRRRPPSSLDAAGVKKWLPYLQGKKRFTPKMVFADPWVLPPSFFLGEEGGSPNRVAHQPGCPLATPTGRAVHLRDVRSCDPAPKSPGQPLAASRTRVAPAGSLFHITFDVGPRDRMPLAAPSFLACPAEPRYAMPGESKRPRVSFAPSVVQALAAVGFFTPPLGPLTNKGTRWSTKNIRAVARIYTNRAPVHIYTPTAAMVPDVHVTGEVWSLDPVEVELVGEIGPRTVMGLSKAARRANRETQGVGGTYWKLKSTSRRVWLIWREYLAIAERLPRKWRLGVDTAKEPQVKRLPETNDWRSMDWGWKGKWTGRGGQASRVQGDYLREPTFAPRTIDQRWGAVVWRGKQLSPRQTKKFFAALGTAARELAPHAHLHPLLWDLVEKTGHYQQIQGAAPGARQHWMNNLGMTELEVEALFVAARLVQQGRAWELDALEAELLNKEADLEDVGDFEAEPMEATVEDEIVEAENAVWGPGGVPAARYGSGYPGLGSVRVGGQDVPLTRDLLRRMQRRRGRRNQPGWVTRRYRVPALEGLVPWDATMRWVNQYRGTQGTARSSRFTPPAGVPVFPAGTWRISDMVGAYGRSVEQLVELRPQDLVRAERAVESNEGGRGDDARRYEAWMRQGLRPPPISVVETDGGDLRVTDGHRRLAAAQAAGRPVLAWVSWSTPSPAGVDAAGRPMATGLTWELAHDRGWVERPRRRRRRR